MVELAAERSRYLVFIGIGSDSLCSTRILLMVAVSQANLSRYERIFQMSANRRRLFFR